MIAMLIPLCLGPVDALMRWSDPQPPVAPPLAASGGVELVEDELPVHTKVSVELVYTADEALVEGDIIRVEEPIFHGMRWSKWGYLTTDASRCSPLSETEEASGGFVTAVGPSGATLAVTHSANSPDIHFYGTIDIEVVSGVIPPGDTITVRLGVEDNDCGWQTSNRTFDQVPIRVFEIRDGGEPALIEPVPTFSFVPEDEVALVRAFLPSTAQVGEALTLRVAELDRWGNVAGEGEVTVEEVSFDEPGIHRVEVTRGDFTVLSNPVLVTEEAPQFRIYWGDLHTHHGHSYEDGETGEWINTNHAYARDVMGLDFASESVKAPPHELDYENLWEAQKRACREYTADGSYVALLGFEWMGDANQGHHNVYFDGCEADNGSSDWESVDAELWPYVESVEAELGYNAVTIPHASSYTGFNWRVRDDRLRPVAEVYSEWASSMDESQPGNVPDGLRSGNRFGLIAASDNHDGWLGNTLAKKDAPGGVGAILAEQLTATDLILSMQAHRTYATTGERIMLQVEVEDGGEVYPPGSGWPVDAPVLRWVAAGTSEIARVDVRLTGIPDRGESVVWASWEPGELDAEGEIALPWGANEVVAWVEVTQTDGELAWSSPFWLEPPELAEAKGCSSSGGRAPFGAWLLALPLVLLGRRPGLRRR
jgi:hypothetical protein